MKQKQKRKRYKMYEVTAHNVLFDANCEKKIKVGANTERRAREIAQKYFRAKYGLACGYLTIKEIEKENEDETSDCN